MIVVIDSGVANLRSVANALNFLGASMHITDTPAELTRADKIILPGVGAFEAGMNTLRARHFINPLREYAARGVPILGICLGMQLIFERSEEMGDHEGLGLIPGSVVRFPPGEKVPHMGWNQLTIQRESPLVVGINDGAYAYFVHSYYAQTAPEHVIAACAYSVSFPAVVARGNVYGAQFHPEKSQTTGLQLLRNFMVM
ncbi:MAG TPA: imidazole glycerol phosphate synthase subunit HisH [Aggregatilineales bacterium]|nr:imidazole glycerol phosphate synthase subunit HisH [Anaerolineales bacterium]HRE48479.1 imidazole glycerol phosphate synthase subunit HisH [Aggregatilineales bacterium]